MMVHEDYEDIRIYLLDQLNKRMKANTPVYIIYPSNEDGSNCGEVSSVVTHDRLFMWEALMSLLDDMHYVEILNEEEFYAIKGLLFCCGSFPSREEITSGVYHYEGK